MNIARGITNMNWIQGRVMLSTKSQTMKKFLDPIKKQRRNYPEKMFLHLYQLIAQRWTLTNTWILKLTNSVKSTNSVIQLLALTKANKNECWWQACLILLDLMILIQKNKFLASNLLKKLYLWSLLILKNKVRHFSLILTNYLDFVVNPEVVAMME